MNYKTWLSKILQMRKFSSTKIHNTPKNHYNSLGISNNATQADIKNAYYELSKVYHPDKQQGNMQQKEENAEKFRDISEAYEVLGNVRTRKLYDKGFFMSDTPHSTQSEDPLHKFYKSRETRTRPPPPSGRTTVYNFDEWAKMHYGRTFHKKQEMKSRHILHNKMEQETKESKNETVLFLVVFFMFMCIVFKESQAYDVVLTLGKTALNKKDNDKNLKNAKD